MYEDLSQEASTQESYKVVWHKICNCTLCSKFTVNKWTVYGIYIKFLRFQISKSAEICKISKRLYEISRSSGPLEFASYSMSVVCVILLYALIIDNTLSLLSECIT